MVSLPNLASLVVKLQDTRSQAQNLLMNVTVTLPSITVVVPATHLPNVTWLARETLLRYVVVL